MSQLASNTAAKMQNIVTDTAIITGYRSVKAGSLKVDEIIPDVVAVSINRVVLHDYLAQKAGELLKLTDPNIKEFAANSVGLGLGFVGSDMLFGESYSIRKAIGQGMMVSGVNFLVKNIMNIE